MNSLNITYNTARTKLIIPEYGRHVQNLVEHAKTIEDKEERQKWANYIVSLMLQMSPVNSGNQEFKEKMWVHFFKIAQYDIDVTPPNGVIPEVEESGLKPKIVSYPKRNHRYRHYGQVVQKLVDSAISMEEGPKKEEFKQVIGSYMKLAYKNWSKEHYVNDEVIKEELKNLSRGKLLIPEELDLNKIKAANRTFSNNNNNKSRGKKGGSHHSNKNRKFKKKR